MTIPVEFCDVSPQVAGHYSSSTLQPALRVQEVNDDDDAALARKLQQEMDDEDMARRMSQDSSAERKRRHLDQLPAANRDATIVPIPIVRGTPVTDEEVARKMEQELQDEQLAHQMTLQETRLAAGTRTAMNPTHPRCSARRFCGVATCTLIVAAIVVVLLLLFVGGSGLNLIGMNPNFAQNDPYYNNTNVTPWDNGGHGGLKLQIINALDAKWNAEFQKAVYQWDNGNPDALTLSTSDMSPDPTCTQIMGKLKVCNGNYGDTYWLGINEQLIQTGWLIASAARMNDYYLDNAIESQRQYTMCHEMGHGFGLPHTDENFYFTLPIWAIV